MGLVQAKQNPARSMKRTRRGKPRSQPNCPDQKTILATSWIVRELLEKFSDLTRRAQAHAVENAWKMDWTQFAQFRREETEAKAAGNSRKALKAVAEMIALLGVAGRFHRKTSG